jgi:Flp pilus assembly protein TadG
MRQIALERHDSEWHGRLVALGTQLLGTLSRLARGRQGLLHDQRGVTALMFAVSALVILGFTGLATEVGIWYTVRREAQGAADAAAIAGALAANVATDPAAAASTAAQDVATLNGFPSGGGQSTLGTIQPLVVNYHQNYDPTAPSTYSCTTCTIGAVEVIVSEAVAPLISALFGGQGVTVGARSFAMVEPIGPACALSLGNTNSGSGDLTVSGTVLAGQCGLASNATDSAAVAVSGAGTIALSATAVGGCCGTVAPTLLRPAAPYHPPTTNPYTGADTAIASFPTLTCATAVVGTSLSVPITTGGTTSLNTTTVPSPFAITLEPFETTTRAYCNTTIEVDSGMTVTLQPGTYIFVDGASLDLEDGKTQGNAVTILFVPPTPFAAQQPPPVTTLGTLTIKPAATVLLTAASSHAALASALGLASLAALDGILFYGQGTSTAMISVTSGTPLEGAIYFPNAALLFSANTNGMQCLPLVAGTMSLAGSFSLFPHCGSPAVPPMPEMMGARVVQ